MDETEQEYMDGSEPQESVVESSKIDRLQRENAEIAKIISAQRFTASTQRASEALFNPIVEKINELVEAAEQYASFLLKRKNPIQEDEDDEDYIAPTLLTKQPTILKNGILKDYQIVSLNWLIALYECGINGILADEMGLGKTVQTISLIGYLKQYKGISKHFLIVAPKSTLGNWMLEFQKWLPDCKVIKLIAVKEEREEIINKYLKTGNFDVCVTSFEGVQKCFPYLNKFKFKYLIVDEAHKLKNELTQSHTTLKSLRTQYKLFLTGTPLQNNPHELWSLLNFLLPDLFHSSDVFDQWFEVQAKSIEGNLSQEQVMHQNQALVIKFQRVLRPFMLRRTKLEVEKELPKKKEIHLYIQMTKYQKELYQKILLNQALDESLGKKHLQNKLMQLRKICLHPYLFPDTEDRNLPELGEHLIDVSAKMKLLDVFLKKLNKDGHQVLLFSQFTSMLNIIEDFCNYRQYTFCRIDGTTELVLREEQIADFTSINSDKFIFLLSTRAGGLGINLASADRVIIFDSDFNPQIDMQAMDRAHRIGQKNPVMVYRLVCKNTIEEKIIERQQVKLRWDKMIIQQGMKSAMKTLLSKEELKDIVAHGAQQIFADNEEWNEINIEEILLRGEKMTQELNDGIDKQMGLVTRDAGEFELGLKSINIYDYFSNTGQTQDQTVLTAKKQEIKQKIKNQQAKPTKLQDFLVPIVIEEYQLFPDPDRVLKLKEKQNAFKVYWELEEKQIPVFDSPPSPLTAEESEELVQLLEAGFPDWTQENFKRFVSACEKFGRHDFDKIALYVGKPREKIQLYSKQFFQNGKDNYLDLFLTNVINQIEKAETKLDKMREIQELVERFIGQNNIEDIKFEDSIYKRIVSKTLYTENFDKLLLLGVQEVGFNNWIQIKHFVLNHPLNDQLNFGLKYITEHEIQQRINSLIKILQSTSNKKSMTKQEDIEDQLEDIVIDFQQKEIIKKVDSKKIEIQIENCDNELEIEINPGKEIEKSQKQKKRSQRQKKQTKVTTKEKMEEDPTNTHERKAIREN